MGDEEKKSEWAASLAEAGLLDNIEEGWQILGEAKSGSVIKVDGKTGKYARVSYPPEPELKPLSLAVPYPSAPPTPLENEIPSDAGPWEPSESPTPIDRDYPGLFRGTSHPPARDVSDSHAASENRSGDNKARSTMRFDQEPNSKSLPARKMKEKMVPVIPEPAPRNLDARTEICDEPPVLGDPSAIFAAIDECRDRVAEMRDHYDMGNFSGVLEIAREVLIKDPQNEEAKKLKKLSEETLIKMYESRIGSFTKIPKMAISHDEVIWRNLDSVSGFLLSHVDGSLTFEDLVDISGMSRFETCRILSQLIQDGIIK